MKKNYFLLLIVFLFVVVAGIFAEDDAYTVQNLITTIQRPCEPVIHNGYVIFTAHTSPRSVGIAFDFEDFKNIYQFQKLVTRDINNEPVDSVLFYILKIPAKTYEISYKLIIDGLWTLDPLNPAKKFDTETNITLSTVKIENTYPDATEQVQSNVIRFVYEGETGQKIRLAGSFTNWDSFIYELTETKPGFYEIYLPLPSGIHYYNYYKGADAFIDKRNPNRVYTADGRTASVITLQ